MKALRALGNVYNRSYDKRPILTLCIANGILGAISDGLAQAITYYEKAKINQKLPEKIRKHEDLWPPEQAWDVKRTFRFAAYNFCVAPIAGSWYIFLDRFFPMPVVKGVITKAVQQQIKRKTDTMALKRMVADQALFAPAGLVVFFTAMGLLSDGNKKEAIKEKFRDAYVPALIANYKVWPLAQFINFKFMPVQYRLPFASSLGILWNAYLSWLNNASKQEQSVLEKLENEDTNIEIIHSS